MVNLNITKGENSHLNYVNSQLEFAPAWSLNDNKITVTQIADSAFYAKTAFKKQKKRGIDENKDYETAKENYRKNAIRKSLRPALAKLGINMEEYHVHNGKGYNFKAPLAYFCWFILTSNTQRYNYFSKLIHDQPISEKEEADFFLCFSLFLHDLFEESVPLYGNKADIISFICHK